MHGTSRQRATDSKKTMSSVATGLAALQRKNSKNPRLLWKWVGGSRSLRIFCFEKSSQNSPKPALIYWSSIPCVFCLYTLLKVVGYYDLSVLPMSVICFKKKMWMGGGWVG